MKNIITNAKVVMGMCTLAECSTTYLLLGTVSSSCNLQLTERVTCYVAFLETVKLEKGRNPQEPLKSQTFSL